MELKALDAEPAKKVPASSDPTTVEAVPSGDPRARCLSELATPSAREELQRHVTGTTYRPSSCGGKVQSLEKASSHLILKTSCRLQLQVYYVGEASGKPHDWKSEHVLPWRLPPGTSHGDA
eukprot:3787652-Amphidinium_carterae.1